MLKTIITIIALSIVLTSFSNKGLAKDNHFSPKLMKEVMALITINRMGFILIIQII